MTKISTIGPDNSVFCGEAGLSLAKMKKGPEFEQHFKQRFPGAEIVLYAPYVYDAVNVLAMAMVKAQSADPEKYLPALAKTDIEGVTAHIRFDSKGDLQDASIALQTFDKGKRVPLAIIH
jgi:branched-chain amino acid transport system substrate-binding protein